MGVNSLPKTASRLRFEPRPFCAWFQHANHSATEPHRNERSSQYSMVEIYGHFSLHNRPLRRAGSRSWRWQSASMRRWWWWRRWREIQTGSSTGSPRSTANQPITHHLTADSIPPLVLPLGESVWLRGDKSKQLVVLVLPDRLQTNQSHIISLQTPPPAWCCRPVSQLNYTHTNNRLTALFPGLPKATRHR